MASAARMATIITTIISSSSVKPRLRLACMSSVLQDLAPHHPPRHAALRLRVLLGERAVGAGERDHVVDEGALGGIAHAGVDRAHAGGIVARADLVVVVEQAIAVEVEEHGAQRGAGE